jgi:DNA repair protein RadC
MAFYYNSGSRPVKGKTKLFAVGHKLVLIPLTVRAFQNFVLAIISKQKKIMEYQINVNYRFQAVNEREAKEKAKNYLSANLKVKAMPGLVCSPLEIAERCWDFRERDKECFAVFFLNTQNQIISREIISIGTLNASLIHPRECFRTAISKNCAAVIFVHNHPSGSLEPSDEDIAVTKRLKDAGKLIGIEVLDHVIVTAESHKSLKELNLI